jgi:cytochrome aa3-600 menaquinol oxidase subunit IV
MAKKKTNQQPQQQHKESPMGHIIGFALSLIMTFAALYASISMDLPKPIFLTVIIGLAIAQALLQLLMFMHLNEGTAAKYQIWTIIYAVFVALVTVLGTIWIMLYNMTGH